MFDQLSMRRIGHETLKATPVAEESLRFADPLGSLAGGSEAAIDSVERKVQIAADYGGAFDNRYLAVL